MVLRVVVVPLFLFGIEDNTVAHVHGVYVELRTRGWSKDDKIVVVPLFLFGIEDYTVAHV
jgi:sirohydrochlorin ferrochelatase